MTVVHDEPKPVGPEGAREGCAVIGLESPGWGLNAGDMVAFETVQVPPMGGLHVVELDGKVTVRLVWERDEFWDFAESADATPGQLDRAPKDSTRLRILGRAVGIVKKF